MDKFKYTLVILLFLIFFSCTKSKNDIKYDHETIVINIKEDDKEVNFSNIIESIDIIPLETTQECLLGNILALYYDDGLYFIQNDNDYLTYVFDEAGKFKHQLAQRGHGPGELQFPELCFVNKQNKEIWMSNNNTFLRYNYQGRYLGKRNYSLAFSDFCIDKKQNIYFYTGRKNNIHIQDGFLTGDLTVLTPNNQKKTWFKSELVKYYKLGQAIHSFSSLHPFCLQSDNSITFSYTTNDTIYAIKDDFIIDPKYCIHFNNNSITTESLNNMPGEKIRSYIEAHPDTYWNINNVFENESHLYFTYKKGFDSLYTFLRNKKTKKDNYFILKDDLFNNNWLKIKECTDSSFIGYTTAYEIKTSNKIKQFISDSLYNRLKEIQSEDNPIIFKFKFKQNIQQ